MSAPAAYGTAVSSDPAADGTEHAVTISEGVFLVSFCAALVTDANAATRSVKFTVEDASGRVYYNFAPGATQIASLTRVYQGRIAEYAAPAVADNVLIVPLPGPEGAFITPGSIIKTVTTSKQATDNWGVFAYQFKRPE